MRNGLPCNGLPCHPREGGSGAGMGGGVGSGMNGGTNRSARSRALLAGLAALALLLPGGERARGSDLNFAGTAQLDYLAVPTREDARRITFDGFTTELSLKLSADVTEHISAQVKACYGCHGFELGTAFIDLRVADPLTFRVGRFTPSFGDFPMRHDPANHLTSDKPLPYDMGRMLRLREWSMSVLPAPYVDNGLEVRGTVFLGEAADMDYAAYVVGGLRGGAEATDVDFQQSRSGEFYYVDNNSRPSVGGRLAFAFHLAARTSLKIAASAFWGTYDPTNALEVLVLGGDLVLRVAKWTLRGEYLVRRTDLTLGDTPADRFRYAPGASGSYDDFFMKDGWYVETDYPVHESVELVARFDGLRRLGNVTTDSPLRSKSMIFRYTIGGTVILSRTFRIKLSGEFYDFSDFADEVAIHAGVVGAF